MFTESDKHRMEATEGWLGLGNWREAQSELDTVAGNMQDHPDVLRLRWEIYRSGKQWERAAEIGHRLTEAIPDNSYGWVHFAYALHELKRTAEARAAILPVVDKFPSDYILPYNLACYECQLGNHSEAMQWLEKAKARAGKKVICKMAMQDADLEPLWPRISELE